MSPDRPNSHRRDNWPYCYLIKVNIGEPPAKSGQISLSLSPAGLFCGGLFIIRAHNGLKARRRHEWRTPTSWIRIRKYCSFLWCSPTGSARRINGDKSTVLTLSVRGSSLYVSAGIVFIRQNLTSVDVRFWRIKTIPALKESKYYGL